MPNDSDKRTTRVGLKTSSTLKGMWKSVKYRAHNEDFSELLWASKKSASEFKMLYEEAVKDGTTDIYSQEYLNVPLDESVTFFKRADFLPVTEEDAKKPLHYYITADLAISESERADYSVFVVAGVDENKIIHIKDVIRERMDGREIVDTLLSLHRIYEPEAIGIEDMQVSKSIGPFLREEMIKTNTYLTLLPLKHGGRDKTSRSRSVQARMRAHGIKFDKGGDWYPIFENECLTFPRGKHDDQVDAFAYLGLMLDKLIEAPTKEEQEDDEYESEFRESGSGNGGQSATTGY